MQIHKCIILQFWIYGITVQKSKMGRQDCIPGRGSRGESISLPFLLSRGCPSLACVPTSLQSLSPWSHLLLSRTCYPHSESPNFITCNVNRLRFSQIISPKSSFPQFLSFVLHFTRSSQKKLACTFNALPGNFSSNSKLIAYQFCFPHSVGHNSAKLSATRQQRSPFLQFPITCASFPSEPSLEASLPSVFLPIVC